MELEITCGMCWYCAGSGLKSRCIRLRSLMKAMHKGRGNLCARLGEAVPSWQGFLARCAGVRADMPAHAGYAPQAIAFNEFFEATGTTCAVDLFYEGKVCAAL